MSDKGVRLVVDDEFDGGNSSGNVVRATVTLSGGPSRRGGLFGNGSKSTGPAASAPATSTATSSANSSLLVSKAPTCASTALLEQSPCLVYSARHTGLSSYTECLAWSADISDTAVIASRKGPFR